MIANIQDPISTKKLYKQYNWYSETFSQVVQQACDDFFTENFKIQFVGLSKNINCLLKDEYCFVTKIKISEEYDLFFRLTESSVNIILNKILGKSNNRFEVNKISELEAKIITTFNSSMYDALKAYINKPDSTQIRRTNFDMINLTFILKNIDENYKEVGKFIVSLPEELIPAVSIESNGEKFSKEDFSKTNVTASVFVGQTKFSMYDLRHIESGDVVVFENSDINKLSMEILGEKLEVNINPNMDLIISDDNDNSGGDDNMSENNNLWDSIQVDMSAEFDAVKISLGELKNIEKGLVVDLTSLYDNNVTLKVEGKPLANGALVIVNDRYGVKINEVLAPGSAGPSGDSEEVSSEFDEESNNEEENYEENEDQAYDDSSQEYEEAEAEEESQGDEDFDYSDFELEDENL